MSTPPKCERAGAVPPRPANPNTPIHSTPVEPAEPYGSAATGGAPRWVADRRIARMGAIDKARRELHAAQAAGDADAEDAAILALAAAVGELQNEERRLAESWRLLSNAALVHQPDEVATWLANLLETPIVKAYLRDYVAEMLATLPSPTVDRQAKLEQALGQFAEQSRQIADLQTVVAALRGAR